MNETLKIASNSNNLNNVKERKQEEKLLQQRNLESINQRIEQFTSPNYETSLA
jgi:hypothetical protein